MGYLRQAHEGSGKTSENALRDIRMRAVSGLRVVGDAMLQGLGNDGQGAEELVWFLATMADDANRLLAEKHVRQADVLEQFGRLSPENQLEVLAYLKELESRRTAERAGNRT